MSQMGHERRIGAVRNISALPPRADVGVDIVEPSVSAITGCEHLQQRRPHSITSSARASSVAGTPRPNILASSFRPNERATETLLVFLDPLDKVS
jgi:hypothetical protein